jgi:hypothetical protein
MADLLNFLMLICASVGAMVFGILAAYGILRTAFSMMRRHAHPGMAKAAPLKASTRAAQIS